jgi:methionine synthase II (cobalamin-independent)
VKPGVIERLAAHCNRVPRDVELGVHLCYGSYGGRHWKEPESTANMVEVHNRLAAGLERPLDYLHMPVPVDRSDDAYFAPLAGLRLDARTKLFLGLIHDSDGIEGTRARIAAAVKYAGDFGVATECGFGRRPPETIPNLLRLHAEI